MRTHAAVQLVDTETGDSLASWPEGYVPRAGEIVEVDESGGHKRYRAERVFYRMTRHAATADLCVLTAFVVVRDL